MPTYIIRLIDPRGGKAYCMEWSTIVDAPVTEGMSLPDFMDFYRRQYGESKTRCIGGRLERVERTGISSECDTLEQICRHNRAGERETSLDYFGLLDAYCRPQREPDGATTAEPPAPPP